MKALQSCLSRFMNACTDMLEKYNDMRQEEVNFSSFNSVLLLICVCLSFAFIVIKQICGMHMFCLQYLKQAS